MTIIIILAVGIALGTWCAILENRITRLQKSNKEFTHIFSQKLAVLVSDIIGIKNTLFIFGKIKSKKRK